MANSHYLPQEILLEIFSYLPIKSVGKFRCLSKTWNTNLSNSQFIKLHQTRKTHHENLIIISKPGFLHTTTPSLKTSINKSKYPVSISFSTGITQLGDGWTKVLGSCNGLVLLGKDNMNFVVNPVTRQQVQIPDPPSVLIGYEKYTLYGFGYDSSCDDYKVVALSPESVEYEDDIVDVYSMKTRVWENVGYSPYECHAGYKPFMAFMNGAMHWIARMEPRCGYHICSFDLVNESFREITLPETRDRRDFYKTRLAVFQGCLALLDTYEDGSVDVWVMKEYGVVDSWVRLHIGKKISWSKIKSGSFVGDEEMLCSTDRGWVLYDLKKGISKETFASQAHGSCPGLAVFEESLVSPEQATISS